MNVIHWTFGCVFGLVFTTAASSADIHSQVSQTGNTFVSGADIRIAMPVPADLLAAGGRVSVESEVGADAAVTGGTVDIRAPVRQDLRAAGGTVTIGERVGGDLTAAGGTVKLGANAAVAGDVWLAGGTVSVAGKLARGAKMYANDITLGGEINGPTRLFAQQIRLSPGAKIDGDLIYASANALTPEDLAKVSGRVTREAMPEQRSRDPGTPSVVWLTPLFILSMLLAGVVLQLLAPETVSNTQRELRDHPLRSVLIGLAMVFTVPPVAILLMLSVIGIPVGLALLASYPLLLLAGYLVAAYFIGGKAAALLRLSPATGRGRQTLQLALALVLLSAVAWIPFLGPLLLLTLLLAGIGCLTLRLYPGTPAINRAPDMRLPETKPGLHAP